MQIGDRFVPTIGAKSLLLNFAERLSDPARVISAADVIAGTVPKKKIDGKIVLSARSTRRWVTTGRRR